MTTSAIPSIPSPTAGEGTSSTTVAGSGATPITPPAEHAGVLHTIFTDLEKAAHLLTDPAVLALLPGKYKGYALAIAAIEHVAEGSAP